MNKQDCILFSGGAKGSEAAFGAIAEEHGIEEVNFSFEGHSIERQRGLRVLNHEELLRGDVSLEFVSSLMNRRYTETPTLPFATLGTLGWSHSSSEVDDGSSQFFFFLYEAELNPAGRNLIDGRNAAFGYVIEGFDVLEELTKDDTIISINVLEGIENLKLNA